MIAVTRSAVAAGFATAALLGLAASPAAAVERTYSANGSYTTPAGKLNQGANARVLNGDADSVNVQLECFANTSPPGVSAGVSVCEIRGADGSVHKAAFTGNHPGPVYLTGGLFVEIPRQHYRVCVRGLALWMTNDYFVAPEVCSA